MEDVKGPQVTLDPSEILGILPPPPMYPVLTYSYISIAAIGTLGGWKLGQPIVNTYLSCYTTYAYILYFPPAIRQSVKGL